MGSKYTKHAFAAVFRQGFEIAPPPSCNRIDELVNCEVHEGRPVTNTVGEKEVRVMQQ